MCTSRSRTKDRRRRMSSLPEYQAISRKDRAGRPRSPLAPFRLREFAHGLAYLLLSISDPDKRL